MCIGVIPGGCFAWSPKDNLTNFKCFVFVFVPKLCLFFVCLKTQTATPKCSQPNPSLHVRARFCHCLHRQNKQLRAVKSLTARRCRSVLPTLTTEILMESIPRRRRLVETKQKNLEISHIDRGGGCLKSPARNQHLFGFVYLFVFGCFDGNRRGAGDRTHLNIWLPFLGSFA